MSKRKAETTAAPASKVVKKEEKDVKSQQSIASVILTYNDREQELGKLALVPDESTTATLCRALCQLFDEDPDALPHLAILNVAGVHKWFFNTVEELGYPDADSIADTAVRDAICQRLRLTHHTRDAKESVRV